MPYIYTILLKCVKVRLKNRKAKRNTCMQHKGCHAINQYYIRLITCYIYIVYCGKILFFKNHINLFDLYEVYNKLEKEAINLHVDIEGR